MQKESGKFVNSHTLDKQAPGKEILYSVFFGNTRFIRRCIRVRSDS